MTREKAFVGNAAMAQAMVYGNGTIYAATVSGKLSEFDMQFADRIDLIGQSAQLPAPATAICINNISNKTGVRTRYYDNEFLRGAPVADFYEDNIDFVRDVTTSETQALLAQLPFDIDYNHHSIEMDFFYVSQREGTTYLSFNTDDGVRVYVGSELVLEKWQTQTPGNPGDPDRTIQVALGLGQRVRFKVEYADAKAVTATFQMYYSFDNDTYAIVPQEHLLAVARTGTRFDGELVTDSEIPVLDPPPQAPPSTFTTIVCTPDAGFDPEDGDAYFLDGYCFGYTQWMITEFIEINSLFAVDTV